MSLVVGLHVFAVRFSKEANFREKGRTSPIILFMLLTEDSFMPRAGRHHMKSEDDPHTDTTCNGVKRPLKVAACMAVCTIHVRGVLYMHGCRINSHQEAYTCMSSSPALLLMLSHAEPGQVFPATIGFSLFLT